jgi:hypothetical protein
MQIVDALAFTISGCEAGQLCISPILRGSSRKCQAGASSQCGPQPPDRSLEESLENCLPVGGRTISVARLSPYLHHASRGESQRQRRDHSSPGRHVSKRMLERYSHVRLAAKEAAIADLERPASTLTTREPARSPDVSDHSPETPTIARRER